MPACTPIVTRLFAHARSSSLSIRFGIAAREAEKNGQLGDRRPERERDQQHPDLREGHRREEDAAATPRTRSSRVRRSNRSPRAPAKRPDEPGHAEGQQQGQRLHERASGSLPHGEVERRVRGGATGDGDQPSGGETTDVGLRVSESWSGSFRRWCGGSTTGLRGATRGTRRGRRALVVIVVSAPWPGECSTESRRRKNLASRADVTARIVGFDRRRAIVREHVGRHGRSRRVSTISASPPFAVRPTSIVAMLMSCSPRIVPTRPMMPGRSSYVKKTMCGEPAPSRCRSRQPGSRAPRSACRATCPPTSTRTLDSVSARSEIWLT